jgi:hypothetical protein
LIKYHVAEPYNLSNKEYFYYTQPY